MYPKLIFDQKKSTANIHAIKKICDAMNIKLTGVIKGCNAIEPFIETLIECGVQSIGSSRHEQLKKVKAIDSDVETMLLRVPMHSELENMIHHTDVSLQSELSTITRLDEIAHALQIRHKVVLMVDLGDLREGFMAFDELLKAALFVEAQCKNVILEGIGTNLGCYGSVRATKENLSVLCEYAEKIEHAIGRRLNLISGGASSSLPLVIEKNMPSRVNHLRVGESILTAREVDEFYGVPIKGTFKDTFILEAEIVEIKTKPTHPIGELFYDAFGNKPSFEDRGEKTRILLAVGRQDFGHHDKLIPCNPDLVIVGSSSDHLIVELSNHNSNYQVGDIIGFELFYPALLYLTESPYVFFEIKC